LALGAGAPCRAHAASAAASEVAATNHVRLDHDFRRDAHMIASAAD
jgi:hypothetical protein